LADKLAQLPGRTEGSSRHSLEKQTECTEPFEECYERVDERYERVEECHERALDGLE
jgi:hypothetical protein